MLLSCRQLPLCSESPKKWINTADFFRFKSVNWDPWDLWELWGLWDLSVWDLWDLWDLGDLENWGLWDLWGCGASGL